MARILERTNEYTIELGQELVEELNGSLPNWKGVRQANARESIETVNQYIISLKRSKPTRRHSKIEFIHEKFDYYFPINTPDRNRITERIKKRIQRRRDKNS